MNVAKCLTLLNWIRFPWLHFLLDCGLSLFSSSCLCHQTTWQPPLTPWLGGWEGRALNSCWPRMCFPSTSINWEEPWVVNPGSGTTQRSLFAITQTTAGTPAWGDAAWWGRVNVWVCPSSLHREVQGPRLQVSCLDHTAHALWISGGKTTSSL